MTDPQEVLAQMRAAKAAGDEAEVQRIYNRVMEEQGEMAPAEPKSGGLAALKSGWAGLKGAAVTGAGRVGLMDIEDAKRSAARYKVQGERAFKPTEEGWLDAPFTKAAELGGQSLPYMAAPVVAGGAAALAGAPALVGMGAAGLASAAQFTGTNLQRQTDEGVKLEDTDLQSAALAALPQAALDMVAMRMTPFIRTLFGKAGAALPAEKAAQIAGQTLKQTAADYAKATGKAMGAEGLTEAAQQVLERMQAGLALNDPAARKEYMDSLIGGAVLGGMIAPVGRRIERGQEAKVQANEKAVEEQKAAAAAEAQALQAQQAAQAEVERNAPAAVAPVDNADPSITDIDRTVAQPTPAPVRTDLFGNPVVAPVEEAAPVSADEIERIQQQVRGLTDQRETLMGTVSQAAAAGDVQASQAALKQFAAVEKALAAAQAEAKALPAPAPVQTGKLQKELARTQEALVRAGEAGDVDNIRKITNRIDKLVAQGAQLDMQQQAFDKKAWVPAGGKVAEAPATPAAPAAPTIPDAPVVPDIPVVDTPAAPAAPEVDIAAAGPLQQFPLRNVRVQGMGNTKTEQQLRIELDIARAAKDNEAARAAIEGLRDIRSATALRGVGVGTAAEERATAVREMRNGTGITNDVSEGAAPEMSSALRSGGTELQSAMGSRLPGTVAQRGAATDARNTAYANLVNLVSRFNKGKAAQKQVDTARQQVLDNLVAEVETARGAPMEDTERKDMLRAADSNLLDLINRFGDTRNLVSMGTKKKPELVPAQYYGGEFTRVGKGPGQPGYPNVESRAPGRQTFASPYAAAMSIKEGLDTLYNKAVEDTGKTAVVPPRLPAPNRADPEVEADPTQVGNVGPDAEAFVFNTPEEFDAYLKGDALNEMRAAMGPVRPTLSQVLRDITPIKAEIAELQGLIAKNKQLQAQQNADIAASTAASPEQVKVDELQERLSGALDNLARAEKAMEMTAEKAAEISDTIARNDSLFGAALRKANSILQIARNEYARQWTRYLAQKNYVSNQTEEEARAKPSPLDSGQLWRNVLAAHDKVMWMLGNQQKKAAAATDPAARALLGWSKEDASSHRLLGHLANMYQSLQGRTMKAAEVVEQLRKELRMAVETRDSRPLTPEEAAQRTKLRDLQNMEEQFTARETALRRDAAKQERVARNPERLAKYDTLQDTRNTGTQGAREAVSNAGRAQQQAQLEAGEKMPGTLVSHEAFRNARDTVIDYTPRIAELEVKSVDPDVPTASQNKAKRELKKLKNAQKYLEGSDEGVAELRLAAEEELAKLTSKKIPQQQKLVADEPTTSRKKELRKSLQRARELTAALKRYGQRSEQTTRGAIADAKADANAYQYMSRNEAVDSEEGSGALPGRKAGPLIKTALQAGNMRTGVAETAEARKLAPRNKIQQSGQKRGATAKQAQREGNATAETRDPTLTAAERAAADEKAKKLQAKQDADALAAEMENEAHDAAEKARQPKIRGEDEIIGDEYDDVDEFGAFDPFAGERELYEKTFGSDKRTELSTAAAEAVKDGRVDEFLERLQSEGSTPFVRDTARKLRPFLLRTKLDVTPRLTNDGKTVAGLYTHSSNRVEMHPLAMTEEDVLHELTHAATMQALTLPASKLTAEQLAARRSIEGLFARIQNTAPFKSEYGNKNVAEFVAETYTNPALREKLDNIGKPKSMWQYVKEFFRKLLGLTTPVDPNPPSSKKALSDIDQLLMPSRKGSAPAAASIFRPTQPQYAATSPLTALADKTIAGGKSFKERLGKNIGLNLEMQTTDMRAGLREALKLGAKAKNMNTEFVQAMASVTKADQRTTMVAVALTQGPLKLYKDAKGLFGVKSSGKNSAKDVFAAVSDIPGENVEAKMAIATTYMIAQRAKTVGLHSLDLGGLGITQADLDAAMRTVDADPKMKAALENVRKKYNAYNEGMIDFLAETGAVPKALATKLLAGGDYVPYYRVDDNGNASLIFSDEMTITLGDVRHQPYLAALKGGQTKIMPLNESLPRNTMLIVGKALSNMAAKNVSYALQAMGAGNIHATPPQAGVDVIKFNQEPDPNRPGDQGQRWIRVKTEGTAMEGIPSELVVRSLEGAHLTLPAFLKWGQVAGDLLRAGITRTPIYTARQLIRDPMAATFTAGVKQNPVKAILDAGKEYVAQSQGSSKTAAELIEKGLIQSPLFTGDATDLSKIALQLADGKDAHALDKLFAMMDRSAMRADASTRALVYQNAIKNGLSEVEADMMTMESMNFHKRGLSPTVQYASRLIPFFNAQIQGLNVLYKAARGQMPFEQQQKIQKQFMHNAMLLGVTGLAYAMAMGDDETFKNAKPRERYTNFFIPLPGGPTIKVPIPYEAGWTFSLPVALVDMMREDQQLKPVFEGLKDMFVASIPGSGNLGMPQLVKPVAEMAFNRNFFTGQDIETAAQRRLDPQERFDANTTETAKALASIIPGISPKMLEFMISEYMGKIPLAAMAAADGLFSDKTTPTRQLHELPLVGSVFQRPFGGADAAVVYDAAEKANMAKATLKELMDRGDAKGAIAYQKEHMRDIALAPVLKGFEQQMANIKKMDTMIRRSGMPADEMRKRLNDLDKARQMVADQYEKVLRTTSVGA